MRWGRTYFAVQAFAGAAWWVAVALSPFVRETTLGSLDTLTIAVFDIPLFVVGSALAALGVRAAAWVTTGWTVAVAVALAIYATITTEAGWGVVLMAVAAAASVLALSLVVLGRIPTEWIIAGPFGFRPAKPGSGVAVLLVTTLGQIVVFWGFFLGVIPAIISVLEHRWAVGMPLPGFTVYIGAIVLVLASALGIWSAVAMIVRGDGTPLPAAMANKLVIAGPYRIIRNPMAAAGIIQGAAVGLLMSSWLVVAYALLGSLLWNYAVRPLEEADLEERFGDDYRRYAEEVRCWIPRFDLTFVPRGLPRSP
jgi:protein-S-isoprenylcysteine O-methyltransferase Ste14